MWCPFKGSGSLSRDWCHFQGLVSLAVLPFYFPNLPRPINGKTEASLVDFERKPSPKELHNITGGLGLKRRMTAVSNQTCSCQDLKKTIGYKPWDENPTFSPLPLSWGSSICFGPLFGS